MTWNAAVDQYKQHLTFHLWPFIGDLKLSSVNAQTIRSLEDTLRHERHSRVMVRMLADAQERGNVARNAVRELHRNRKRGRTDKRHKVKLEIGVHIPTKQEATAIMNAAKGRWRPRGWMNGRGDDTMTMFKGYAHMVDFFTSFDWWGTEPHDELGNGNYCLAKPGETYAVYLPHAGYVTVRIQPGQYGATWWEAASGRQIALPSFNVTAPAWTSPAAPGEGDWALLLRRCRRSEERSADDKRVVSSPREQLQKA